jgi:hypothetical protein
VRRGVAGIVLAILLLASAFGPPVQAQQLRGDPVQCIVTVSTATTLTAVGGACAARAGLRLWITDINFSSSASGIAADSFPTLKYGTGSTCGTGTTVFWGAFTPAAVQSVVIQSLMYPIVLPVAVDVCWINSTAGSKFLIITGYYTP